MSATDEFEKYFRSGNAIPVTQATIPAELAQRLLDETIDIDAFTMKHVEAMSAAGLPIPIRLAIRFDQRAKAAFDKIMSGKLQLS